MIKMTIEIDKNDVGLIKSLVEKLNGKVISSTKSNSTEELKIYNPFSDN